MSTQEHARNVAQAFIELFFNTSKRTAEDSGAFTVYAADSIARITRAKEDGTTEDVTLNGIDSITMYNLSLPPSALTLVHFDALPTHNNGITIMATGTEIIDIIDYPWSRSLVLAPTPQGGFYLVSDMLHYSAGTPLPSTTTEIIEIVEVKPPQQKKARIQNLREKKPRQPRTPVGTGLAPVEQASVENVQTPPAPVAVVETPVVVVEHVEVPIVEPEPVVIEPEPVFVATPQQPSTPVGETPQTSKKSWSQLVSGKEADVKPTRQKREEAAPKQQKEQQAAPVAQIAAPVAPETETKPEPRKPNVNSQQQISVNNIPENISKDQLMLSMVALGDVSDIFYTQGKKFAVVTFKTVAEAQEAINLGTLAVGKATVTLSPKVQKDSGFRSVNKRK